MAEFRVLGPVEVWADGDSIHTGHPRQRVVLTALLVDAGRLVTVESLMDRVWGEEPPDGVRRTLQSHITRVRRLVAEATALEEQPARLVRQPGGYLLELDPTQVDLHRFRALVDRARTGTGAARAEDLRAALDLWRGEPLAGLPGDWAARTRESLHRQRQDALVAWAAAVRDAGDGGAAIEALMGELHEAPLAEPVAVALIRALHAAGRAAQALDCFAQVRKRLVADLGAEPGPELQQAHQEALRGTPSAVGVPSPAAVSPVPQPVPDQLPLDVWGFAGRTAALARLDAIQRRATEQPTAVLIATVSGTAGVGKTSLAVHWAHRNRARFADGCLYVNLRGFDADRPPTPPSEALRRFLHALGTPADQVPPDVDDQADLYRRKLAGRRILIVLDNARDAGQVRPLLPGTAGCPVLVTSRNQLTGLIVAAGAQPVPLDVLDAAEARELLTRRLGADRIAAEPAAVDRIVDRCAGLPLALTIVAARAAIRPEVSLAVRASEVDEAPALSAYADGDPATDVRAVFSWSYQALSDGAARLFRLLGLSPAPDIGADTVASLAGLPLAEVRAPVTELIQASLLTEPVRGRYAMHDLIRAYAGGLAEPADRDPAVRRMLDYYLHTAYHASVQMNPGREAIAMASPQPGVTPGRPRDYAEAFAWYTAEYLALRAAQELAESLGLDTYVWQLAWAQGNYQFRTGRLHEGLAVDLMANAAAQRLGDPAAEALTRRNVAAGYTRLGRPDVASEYLRRALELYRQVGDRNGEAHTTLGLAHALELQHRYQECLDLSHRALDLYRQIGDLSGQAYALNGVAWYHSLLDEHEEAVAPAEEALALCTEIGAHHLMAGVLDTLGNARHHLGQPDLAMDCFHRAIELYRQVGERYYMADTMVRVADAWRSTGHESKATAGYREALEILDEMGHPKAAEVRAKLAGS